MERLDVREGWVIRECGGETEYSVSLPSTNYTALKQHGVIDNPLYGENAKELLWVAERDWEYRLEFFLPSEFLSADSLVLRYRADTLSEVFLNGERVGTGNNAHRTYELDIKAVCKAKNILTVRLLSPVNYINKRQKTARMPRNNNGLNGAQLLRKPAYHFGWDWAPILPLSGISFVTIDAYSDIRLIDPCVTFRLESGRAFIASNPKFTAYSDENVEATFTVTAPDGTCYTAVCGEEAVIENPELWWCNGMTDRTEQPLYRVETTLKTQTHCERAERHIGLRTITLSRENGDFCFVLNGRRIFAKGANFIPPEMFPDLATEEIYRFYVGQAVKSNYNMLRVWGGGYYADEAFYDLCDRQGILVWQDFCFACMPYPFYETDFLENVMAEVSETVARLKHRASLSLLCGNNEIEVMSAAWMNKGKLRRWTEKFFYGVLPAYLKENAAEIPFIEGSPVGAGYGKKIVSDDVGDTHLWQVWHGLRKLTYYRKRFTRFCSEFGLQSFPEKDSLLSFAKEDELSIHSAVMQTHQKCPSGNQKMLYYVATRFRIPKEFCDFAWLTRLVQAECVQDATEHWRRNTPQCNGSLYWQFNDCWGAPSWSGIDYYQRLKPLHEKAKHFFAPLALSLYTDGKHAAIYVINDTLTERALTVRYGLYDFYGEEIFSAEEKVTVAAGGRSPALQSDCRKYLKNRTDVVFCVRLYDESGRELTERTHLFCPERRLALPNTPISVKEQRIDGKRVLTLSCDVYHRFVTVEGVAVSENCFDLFPNRERKIVLLEEGAYTVKSLNSTPYLSERENRRAILATLCNPMVLINAVAYLFM